MGADTINSDTTDLTVDPSIARGVSKNEGHKPTGAFPLVNRTKLAAELGCHKSTVTNILKGRSKPSLVDSIKMARLIGVSVEDLAAELERRQAKFRSARGAKPKRKAKATKKGK